MRFRVALMPQGLKVVKFLPHKLSPCHRHGQGDFYFYIMKEDQLNCCEIADEEKQKLNPGCDTEEHF